MLLVQRSAIRFFIVIIVEGTSLNTLPNSEIESNLVRTFAEAEKTVNQSDNALPGRKFTVLG